MSLRLIIIVYKYIDGNGNTTEENISCLLIITIIQLCTIYLFRYIYGI